MAIAPIEDWAQDAGPRHVVPAVTTAHAVEHHATAVWAQATVVETPRWLLVVDAIHAAAPSAPVLAVDAAVVAAAGLAATRSAVHAVVAAPLFVACGMLTPLYRRRSVLARQGLAWYPRRLLPAVLLLALTLGWVSRAGVSPLRVAGASVLAAVALFAVRLATWQVVARARRRGLGLCPAVVVGWDDGMARVARRLAAFPDCGLHLVAACQPTTEALRRTGVLRGDVPLVVSGALHLILVDGDVDEAFTETVLREARPGVRVGLLVPLARLARQPVGDPIADLAVLPLAEPRSTERVTMPGKRAFDVVAAAVAIILTAPLMAVTALAIAFDSGRPVLYRQLRVGRKGELFKMRKFRSMVPGAELLLDQYAQQNTTDGLLFKLSDDPRVTRVGKLIRRLGIDELPQLFDVLLGHMSIVGPRPLAVDPADFDEVGHERHAVRPGLTGAWQVHGGNALSYEDMVEIDLAYIANWSIWSDLRILARTPGALLVRRGAF